MATKTQVTLEDLVYRATNPDTPAVYRRGNMADAEPALPGWTMPLDDLFG